MVDKFIGILMAFILLSALAAIISKRADTANVLTAFFKGFRSMQDGALAPITSAPARK